jgi:micrococcal nuclease
MMKKWVVVCTVIWCGAAYAGKGVEYSYPIVDVKDGDTVVFEADFLPPPFKQELSLRVYGVDTPEKAPRAKCVQEAEKGLAATQFTKKVVAESHSHTIVLYGWDKFGGRVLGDVLLDGKSLREMLIQQNLARPYFGEAKQSWCN